jgi:hypothetical protein
LLAKVCPPMNISLGNSATTLDIETPSKTAFSIVVMLTVIGLGVVMLNVVTFVVYFIGRLHL